MFRNSGKKIMGFVNFVFYLNLVLTILAVIAGTIFVFLEYGEIMWLVLAAVGCLLVGALYMLIVFLSLLCLYAFGEMVQSTVETKRILTEMQRESERFSPQNYIDPIQASPVTRSKPTIAERKVSAAPAAAPAPAPVQPVGATETVVPAPKEEPAEPARPSFAFDYKSAAGAPGFSTGDLSPRPLFCSKCGAKHDPGTASCRYCGTPLA